MQWKRDRRSDVRGQDFGSSMVTIWFGWKFRSFGTARLGQVTLAGDTGVAKKLDGLIQGGDDRVDAAGVENVAKCRSASPRRVSV